MESNAPSNEEVIDEITRDFSDNLDVDNKECLGKIPDDFESSDNDDETATTTIPDDFVDEEKLAEIETQLSEAQKEDQHRVALEHKVVGNQEFKEQKYLESIISYTDGLRVCPLKYGTDRAILYANRAASKGKLDRKQSAIDDCTQALKLNDTYLKAYLRRAKLYEDTEKLDESLEDYKKILELDGSNQEALSAQVRLPPMINERNEKMKDEMIGKLKDLGNVILRPFGLSTENFKMNQDPTTGGYSINFTQNPR